MDDALFDLYQAIILDHHKRPRNYGELEDCTHKAEGHNPLCGDEVEVQLKVDDAGRIEEVKFTGQGCAISRASASLMTQALKGKTREEMQAEIDRVVELLRTDSDEFIDPAELGDLAAIAGVRQFPARIKCATLGWHTAMAARDGEAKITTDED